jgi:protein gp37
VRRRVFCASLADVFEDRPELDEWRSDLWELIQATPNLDWLLLTKRPEHIPLLASGPTSVHSVQRTAHPPIQSSVYVR